MNELHAARVGAFRVTRSLLLLGLLPLLETGCDDAAVQLPEARPLVELGAEDIVPAAPSRCGIATVASPETDGLAESRGTLEELSVLRVGAEAFGLHVCAQLLGEELSRHAPDLTVDPLLRRHEECLVEVAKGELEAAICTKPLSHRDRRAGLVEHPLGELALAVLVPRTSRVWDLRREQLAEIVAGSFTHWDQLGGPAVPIEPLALEDEDPLWNCAVTELFPGKRSSRLVQRQPNEAVLQVVLGRKPFGLGFVPFSTMQPSESLRAISVQGIYPTEHTIRTHKYPLRVRCSLVVRRKAELDVLRFVSWVTGPGARALLARTMIPTQ